MRRWLAVVAAMAALCALSGAVRAAGVELTVVLAADVSRSVDDGEFELQRKGYAAALTDPRVLKAVHATKSGAVGVCFIEWSGEDDQRIVLPWTEIRDEEDGGGAAAAILKAPRSFTGRTSISAAIEYAMAYFGKATWPAARRIIDISGDGTSNAGPPLTEARDQAIAAGVTINGLAIINNKPNLGYSAHTNPPGGLPNYYRQNVVGGPNAFLIVVKDFNSFADAMANKLTKEINVAAASPGDPRAAGGARRAELP
ncbi:MAG TPA: DUF1194 domain-containing protein [Stellaceae bacterium]|jgi:hypothetical protein|nr:DUF1194 domain-containing protein [Stellaceae bacterium]